MNVVDLLVSCHSYSSLTTSSVATVQIKIMHQVSRAKYVAVTRSCCPAGELSCLRKLLAKQEAQPMVQRLVLIRPYLLLQQLFISLSSIHSITVLPGSRPGPQDTKSRTDSSTVGPSSRSGTR